MRKDVKLTEKRSVGRPIIKKDRTKIGLSITGEANEMLNELVKLTGKTKSKIFEDAIKVMKEREEIIYARMKAYEEQGKEALLDFDELMKNREVSEKEDFKNVG